MIIKALKTFSDGAISMHEGEIANVPDVKAQRFIAEGYAVEYTGEGGEIDLSAYAKKTDLENAIGIREMHYNLFDKSDITPDMYRNTNLGMDITTKNARENGWCSNQIWEVKQGDVIYTSTQWFGLLIYDSSNKLIEYASNSGTNCKYVVTNANAKYLTIQASARNDGYLNNLMISINKELPDTYKEYSETYTIDNFDKLASEIPQDGQIKIDKGFVIISFDAFDLDDDRYNIVYGEYGFKASGAISAGNTIEVDSKVQELYKAMIKAGWDTHLYSGVNWPYATSDSSYISDNPTPEVQQAWDDYVDYAVRYAEKNGVFNATTWGARQGVSCVGLENACKKHGIKMVRGRKANNPIYTYNEKFKYSVVSPANLTADKVDTCIQECVKASRDKYGISFTTHRLYDTEEEATSSFGLTEAKLRQFLDGIKPLVDNGTLEVITWRDLYHRYYPNDSYEYDYDRTAKMIAYNNVTA